MLFRSRDDLSTRLGSTETALSQSQAGLKAMTVDRKLGIWMCAALVVSMAGFPLESLLYIASRQRAALVAQALAAVVYVGLLIWLSHAYGIMGAAVAYFGGQCLEALFSLVPTLAAYRNRHTLTFYAPEEARS